VRFSRTFIVSMSPSACAVRRGTRPTPSSTARSGRIAS
jgi:hypothetical protein